MRLIHTLVVACCFLPHVCRADAWLIVANGPEVTSEELQKSLHNHKIIVLDGAANTFQKLSIYPDVILGDFDSIEDPKYWGIAETFSEIDNDTQPYEGNFSVKIVPAKDQDHTDLEKGIMHCDAKGADSITIVQATGGRLDHTLGNLGVLRKYHQASRSLVIETESEKVIYLKDEEIVVEKGEGGMCAVMGYPRAKMTTQGLAYNGEEYVLELGIQESTCNRITEPRATISIQGEALVILPKSATVKS